MMQLNGYKGNNMSLGGGSSSSQQLDPALKDLFLQNYQGAQTTAAGLAPREFAGFNADQNQAFNLNRLYASPLSAPTLYATDAANLLRQGAQYQPENVSYKNATTQTYAPAQSDASYAGAAERAAAAQLNRGSIRDVSPTNISGSQVATEALSQIAPLAAKNVRDVTAGSFLNQNIQNYMNPFTQAVTEQSLKDIERSRQLEQINTAAKATAAKSFGGSRLGVAEAETNRAYDENVARLVAQQNAQAYEAAQRASEADLARAMQASQLNQAKDLATTSQSLELAGRFGLANQDAALRAALANQGIDFSTGQINTQNATQVALANAAAANRMAEFNAANQQATRLANQAATNVAGQFGAAAANTANLTNAENMLRADLADQSAGLTANQLRTTAGGQLASAATNLQNLGFGQANQLRDQGLIQQGFTQQQLDAIRNLPLEQQQILNQALGINVGGGSGQTSTTTSRQGLLGLFGIG